MVESLILTIDRRKNSLKFDPMLHACVIKSSEALKPFIADPTHIRTLKTSLSNRSGLRMRQSGFVFIGMLPVSDPDDEDNQLIFFNVANDSIIADPVFPKSGQIMGERSAEPSGIIVDGDPLFQVTSNDFPGFSIQTLKFLKSPFIPFNRPSQALSPLLPLSFCGRAF